MGIVLDQIQKALARASGLNMAARAEEVRDSTPREVNSVEQLNARLRVASANMPDSVPSPEVWERIIQGNELQDVNYLARGARAARAVARVSIVDGSGQLCGHGSGFMVSPGVFITNNHVLPAYSIAARSFIEFDYERDVDGKLKTPVRFDLKPEDLFYTLEELDFTVVAVTPSSRVGVSLESYGWLPLIKQLGKVVVGEWLTIIQHPGGDLKQVCVRENQLIRIADSVLWYATDTQGGASGSPVFNNEWMVVALHHSGVPDMNDGRIQTIDGRDWDEQRDGEEKILWIANEGIRVSRIVNALQSALPDHPLLKSIYQATLKEATRMISRPLLREFTPSTNIKLEALGLEQGGSIAEASQMPASITNKHVMSTSGSKKISLKLEVHENGRVELLSGGVSQFESTQAPSSFYERQRRRTREPQPNLALPFDPDYTGRSGYEPALDGTKYTVLRPTLSPRLQAVAAPLIGTGVNGVPLETELRYHNYSVVMNRERRLAFFSAATVRGDQRYSFLSRKDYTRGDPWREDERILSSHQLGSFYYKRNKFDRGHLSRNEDLEYGATWQQAVHSAIDTCHYTNSVPQHEVFNQTDLLWQGLEQYILEESVVANSLTAKVFTGPIFSEGDPVYDDFPNIQYPVQFWKVVAAVGGDKKLFATAYILDQSETIKKYGLETAPFGEYKEYQVPISEVQKLTGLTFKYTDNGKTNPLTDCDPLAKSPAVITPVLRNRFNESGLVDVPDGYLPLFELSNIRLK